ncbi:MAG: alkaline phosphatase family protein [Deltaproteobacteria bacterium]|nr:alkaline phosphatase family protein [Deltaproteobacteria bacterium]
MAAGAQAADVEHVIHIVVEGLNSDMLQDLVENQNGSGDYDGFQRLIDEGASSYNARSDYSHTLDLPNQASMLTGRPVLQPAGQANTVQHGYTDDGDPGGATLHSEQPNVSYVSSVFDVVHDNSLSTAFYGSQTKYVLFKNTYDGAGGPDPIPPDDGSNKLDSYLDDSLDMQAQYLVDLADNDFTYTLLSYVDGDASGHQFGWGTSQWDTSMADVSTYLDEILDLVGSDSQLTGKTAVIVTSDHGGGVSQSMDHTCATCVEHYTFRSLLLDVPLPSDRGVLNLLLLN